MAKPRNRDPAEGSREIIDRELDRMTGARSDQAKTGKSKVEGAETAPSDLPEGLRRPRKGPYGKTAGQPPRKS
jgi:hypothetical protein